MRGPRPFSASTTTSAAASSASTGNPARRHRSGRALLLLLLWRSAGQRGKRRVLTAAGGGGGCGVAGQLVIVHYCKPSLTLHRRPPRLAASTASAAAAATTTTAAAEEGLKHVLRCGTHLRHVRRGGRRRVRAVEDRRHVCAAEAVLDAVGVQCHALVPRELATRDRMHKVRCGHEVVRQHDTVEPVCGHGLMVSATPRLS